MLRRSPSDVRQKSDSLAWHILRLPFAKLRVAQDDYGGVEARNRRASYPERSRFEEDRIGRVSARGRQTPSGLPDSTSGCLRQKGAGTQSISRSDGLGRGVSEETRIIRHDEPHRLMSMLAVDNLVAVRAVIDFNFVHHPRSHAVGDKSDVVHRQAALRT